MMILIPKPRAYQRIASDLRARHNQPGDMLPSEKELTARYAVHRGTVRQALQVLESEGRIVRHRGRGTVVVDRLATGEFAIVINPRLLQSDASQYFGFTSTLIAEYLSARNPRWVTKLRVGRMSDAAASHVAIDLVDPDVLKRLRGVFTFHDLVEIEPKLESAGVPIVMVGSSAVHCSVDFDYVPLYKLGLAHLRAAGCRTLGLLRTVDDPKLTPAIPRLIRANGLVGLPGWKTRCAQPDIEGDADKYGYDLFTRLWVQPTPHPDGILVEDDIVCRGVLRAIQQLRIRVPAELRVVSHAMRGLPIPFHKPVTRVEVDPMQQARQVVEMMMALIRGLKPNPAHITLAGELVQGETT